MIAVTEALRDARGPWEKKAALRLLALREAAAGDRRAWTSTTCSCWSVRLLAEVPEVLAWYRGLWRYVLVDEYQDTNRAQYRIIRAAHRRASQHLRASATPTSRSTSGAGADIRNILDFEDDYPGHQGRAAGAELSLDPAHPGAGGWGHRQQRPAQGQDAVDGERGRATPARALSGVGRARGGRASSPSPSSGLRGEGVRVGRRGRLLPDQRAVARAGGRAAARRASPTSSSAACASTSAARSRTPWPTCASW